MNFQEPMNQESHHINMFISMQQVTHWKCGYSLWVLLFCYMNVSNGSRCWLLKDVYEYLCLYYSSLPYFPTTTHGRYLNIFLTLASFILRTQDIFFFFQVGLFKLLEWWLLLTMEPSVIFFSNWNHIDNFSCSPSRLIFKSFARPFVNYYWYCFYPCPY